MAAVEIFFDQSSLTHLRAVAKSSIVKIEPYNSSTRSFGTSIARRSITFPAFLELLQDPLQRGQWYLTTQYDEDESDEDTGPGCVVISSKDTVAAAKCIAILRQVGVPLTAII